MNSDSLFNLIKSLSPSEKRYFKVFVGANTKRDSNRYIELFEAISKQKKYNEALLIQKLNYHSNPNSFSSAKNYLFQLVLKSLRGYHSGNNEKAVMMGMIRDVELLYDKKLFKSCYKSSQKALKIAEEKQLLEYQLMALNWQIKIAEHLNDSTTYWKFCEDRFKKVKKISSALRSDIDFKALHQKVQFFNLKEGLVKKGEVREVFSKLSNDPLLKDINNTKTEASKIHFHHFYINYYIGLRNLNQQLMWNIKLMDLFQQDEGLKIRQKMLYIKSLATYLFNLLELRHFQKFKEDIGLLKEIEIAEKEYEMQRHQQFEYLYLMSFYYTSIGRFDKILDELLDSIQQYYWEHKDYMQHKNELWMVGNISRAFLGVGNLNEALVWANRVDELIDKHIMVDISIIFKSFLLPIHFELRNASVVDSLAKSLERFLIAKNKMNALEAFSINFFKKAPLLFHDKKALRNLLKEYKNSVHTLSKLDQEKTIFQYGRVLGWIESQLTNKTLVELAKERELNLKLKNEKLLVNMERKDS